MADPAKKRSNPATSRGGESHTRGAKAPRLATRDGPTEGRGGKPRSPPAGGNKTASGPLAAGTSKAGPSNLSPKTGASDAANLGPAKQTRYNCEDCGKAFYTKNGLTRHRPACGTVERTKCQYCGSEFSSFTGVRLHEHRAHAAAVNDEKRERLKRPESELMQIMARIEAATIKGQPFIDRMVSDTGLTRDQVRHRRNKPVYKEYLCAAKEIQTNNLPFPRPVPSAGAARASAHVETPNIEGESVHTETTAEQSPQDITNKEDSEDDGDGKTPRAHIVVTPILQNGGTKRQRNESMSPLMQPTPRRARCDHDLTPPHAQPKTQVTVNHQLRSYLVTEREAAAADGLGHVVELCNAGLELANVQLGPYIDDWIKKHFPEQRGGKKGEKKGNKPPQRNYAQITTGRGPRAEGFKKAQDLFNKNRSSLAEKIISGTPLDEKEVTPPIDEVERLYRGILESPAREVTDVHNKPLTEDTKTFLPFRQDEIENAKTSWGNSAPGADGITVSSVKRANNRVLSVLFSIILIRNVHPVCFRRSRTTIIYKNGQRCDPANWRPLTIGSALQRLMHRAMANRIREVIALSTNQRGFTAVDGTLANCMVLQAYIRNRVGAGKGYCVVSLDVRKAFDTVGHGSVVGALRRFGIDEGSIRYILSTLTTSETAIKVGGEQTGSIQIRRGVKQGDPLSPLLFNMVIDELLSRLNDGNRGGTILPGVKVSAMAFADDIILLEDEEVNLPLTLSEVVEFAGARGMVLNPGKCSAMVVGSVKGSLVPRKEYGLKIDGRRVAMVTEVNSFRYLGHDASVGGILRPSLTNLPSWLSNLKRSPLKPDQKLIIIKNYIIPKLFYGLQTPKVTGASLRSVDRLIKGSVKAVLHLSVHTPDAALYAAIRDGGLGIQQLRLNVPRVFLNRLVKLLDLNEDRALMAALQSDCTRELMHRLEGLAGEVPAVQLWRERLATSPILSGMENSSDDTASRSWLQEKPKGWTGRDFVRAVQLRTNNLPTAGTMYASAASKMCRAGCSRVESLCHVLQQCPSTHWERIRRHNEVAKKVARHCRTKGWTTLEEPYVRHRDGTLFKPDMAIMKGDRVVVADVGVNWEGNIPLHQIYNNKKAVYDNAKFLEAARELWPNKPIEVHAIILGAREFGLDVMRRLRLFFLSVRPFVAPVYNRC
ncbi:unnamed protein product [Acanthoscelides obtectus]|uniref:Reverse transcriptase n=1 Tax=Acanthoscelides obtectus TaxID=200917 RepID=A0A9P0VQD3_ACAOB|nr:unnamed protein product [Acanthoscelides obtectus]CAK1685360.1 hypothetical protein AOBTE_LOCUS35346 [Acanthoscelides obtectus]